MQLFKRFFAVFCILFLAAGCHPASADLSDWVGFYSWSDSMPGAMPAGTPLWESYVISIVQENGRFYAYYTADGYMLGRKAKTEVRGNNEKITLIFLEYAPSTVQQSFSVGDELFSLTKTENGLLTIWITDRPAFGEREMEGVYYKLDNAEHYKDFFDQFY